MNTEKDFDDMRSTPRFRLRSYVNLEDSEQDLDAHLLNISEGGALIAVLGDFELELGEKLNVNIELDCAAKLELSGHISHIKEHYVGLTCEGRRHSEQRRLKQLLEQLEEAR
ncbi:PilZ domain-containing protein [Agaribacterium sp. ZY112]|uniref:PilZ domain-containing protein n=1 Tax=Agaribacterium sp. ZY112 TaxID=3233574 RepID=UPI0035257BF1